MLIEGKLDFSINPIPLNHKSFGESQISFGEMKAANGDMLLTVIERKDERPRFEINFLSSM